MLHRQIKLLDMELDSAEFFYLRFENFSSLKGEDKALGQKYSLMRLISFIEYLWCYLTGKLHAKEVISRSLPVCGINIHQITVFYEDFSPFGFFHRIFGHPKKTLIQISEHIKPATIDFIQASDVREIRFAISLGKIFQCKLIYDSLEDYVRQIIDYQHKSLPSYIHAFIIFLLELVYVRRFNWVFCTDNFLNKKYKKRIYGSKKVNLLRNFPLISDISYDREYDPKDPLKLVYIGSVNRYRGVIETAKYVQEYNTTHTQKLEFSLYSSDSDVVKTLVHDYGVIHHEPVDYAVLMQALDNYDIGICLLLPIKKYYRNIPVKNFDYMAKGLPIITSNFGNLTKYIEQSGSGFCINPRSYKDFEISINNLFDQKLRKQMGLNGRKWVEQEGNFETEGLCYVKSFRNY